MQEHERGNLHNIDAVIQYCPPHFYQSVAGVVNIGVLEWETSHFRHTNWADNCNIMDRIWCITENAVHAARRSGVTTNLRYIGIPELVDFSEVDRLNMPQLQERLVLYTITSSHKADNLSGLLRAYYASFTSRDNVSLVIHLSDDNKTRAELLEYVASMVRDIKNGIHIRKHNEDYPTVHVVTDDLSEQEVLSVHKTGDVFVYLPHGYKYPTEFYRAAMCGNRTIVACNGCGDAFLDLTANSPTAFYPISGVATLCFGVVNEFNQIYSGDESWLEPNLVAASNAMRAAYNDWVKNAYAEPSGEIVEAVQTLMSDLREILADSLEVE
jgi:hypothetical protein